MDVGDVARDGAVEQAADSGVVGDDVAVQDVDQFFVCGGGAVEGGLQFILWELLCDVVDADPSAVDVVRAFEEGPDRDVAGDGPHVGETVVVG